MDKVIYVMPASGLRVIDPATGQPLPAEGRYVPKDTYWRRRLRDGEVRETKSPDETRAEVSRARASKRAGEES